MVGHLLLLLEYGAITSSKNKTNPAGPSHLLVVERKDSIIATSILQNHGAGVDEAKVNKTPLHFASYHGVVEVDCARLLPDGWANARAKNTLILHCTKCHKVYIPSMTTESVFAWLLLEAALLTPIWMKF